MNPVSPPPQTAPDPLQSFLTELAKRQESAALVPKRKGLHPILGKIAMGIFCSTMVTVAMNFLYIKKAILYVCSLVVAIGGTDPEVEKLKDKAKVALVKVEKKEAEGHGGGLLSKIPTPVQIIEDKSKEAVGKAAEKGKEVVVTAAKPVVATVHKVEEKAEQGVNALKNLGQQRAQQVVDPRLVAAAPASSMARSSLARMNEQRANQLMNEQAMYAEWWAGHGPNSRCPACREPLRVSSNGRGNVRCHVARCSFRTTADRARAMGAPEPPRVPPAAYFAWKKSELEKAQTKTAQQ